VTIERVALTLLALIAVVMGANYVSATSRFLDANRAYDRLELTLESFEFSDAASPVLVEIGIENPSSNAIEILAMNVTLRAGIQSVGGGDLFLNDVLEQGQRETYVVNARVVDQNFVSRLEGSEISWLIRGEVQVRLDADIAPVWIQFSVRAVTQ
jgi:hypothetical protein